MSHFWRTGERSPSPTKGLVGGSFCPDVLKKTITFASAFLRGDICIIIKVLPKVKAAQFRGL